MNLVSQLEQLQEKAEELLTLSMELMLHHKDYCFTNARYAVMHAGIYQSCIFLEKMIDEEE